MDVGRFTLIWAGGLLTAGIIIVMLHRLDLGRWIPRALGMIAGAEFAVLSISTLPVDKPYLFALGSIPLAIVVAQLVKVTTAIIQKYRA